VPCLRRLLFVSTRKFPDLDPRTKWCFHRREVPGHTIGQVSMALRHCTKLGLRRRRSGHPMRTEGQLTAIGIREADIPDRPTERAL
jgi:hypothetical protein